MTEKVVHLKKAEPEADKVKDAMLKALETDIKTVTEFLKQSRQGGFAILAFDSISKEGKHEVHSYVNYFTAHPGDGYLLPDMAKIRLLQHLLKDD